MSAWHLFVRTAKTEYRVISTNYKKPFIYMAQNNNEVAKVAINDIGTEEDL